MTYNQWLTRCLSNICQLVVKFLSTAVKFLSTLSDSCQPLVKFLSTLVNPLSNSCQILMPIKSICQKSVNWISWFIRPYNIILYPQKQLCRNSNVQKQKYCAAYRNKQLCHAFLQGCLMSNFDSFCKGLYVNNIKRLSNIFQILFKHFSNVFRINFECFSSSLLKLNFFRTHILG